MHKPVSYGSVCSGIEAASVAWHCLGWQPAWFAEIEKFPSAVLAYRWPDVTNLGDMTQIAAAIRAGKIDAPDLLVGGTPCQAFSVAGLRNGLADERGQLTLAFVDLVNAIDEKRSEQGKSPVIVVWENVPGVFSSKDNAFGCFLAGLAGESCALESPGKRWANAGYVLGPERAIAWRVLDAQFFGVAQRRRRVFVVASARTDIDPAKILFESEGVRRDTAPSRGAGKAVAALTARGVGTCGADDNQGQAGHLIPQCVTGDVSHTLKAEGFDGSEDGTGRGTPIIAMAHGQGGAEIKTDDTAPTLTCNHEAPIVLRNTFTAPAIGQFRRDNLSSTLTKSAGQGNGETQNSAFVLDVFSSNGHASFAAGVTALRAKSGADHETLAVHGTQDPDTLKKLAHTLGRNHRQENAVAYGFKGRQGAKAGGIGFAEEQSPTLTSASSGSNLAPTVMHSVAFAENSRAEVRLIGGDGSLTGAMAASPGKPGMGHPVIVNGMAVRRLTPVECERLQGFSDNYTLIPTQKIKQITAEEYGYLRHHRPELTADQAYRLAADGPRYKAIGNSMAVPVMRWIGSRIQEALRA
ncbi:DNA cytosine methyltransferase [Enterobacter hormaechei]